MATEKEIILKLKADTTGVEQGLNNVEESLKVVNKEVDELGKSAKLNPFEKQLQELNKRVASGTLTMREMSKAVKEYATIALQAGAESPIGKQALNEAGLLKDKIGDLNKSIDNLSKDGRGLQTAMQLGTGIIGGYTAFQGVTAMLGVENKDLQQTFVKLQAAQSALMGVQAIHETLQKESLARKKLDAIFTNIQTAATAAYALVVGTSTGALKLFRIALVSTGIGALIVGIGLLIANFKEVAAWAKNVANAMMALFGFVDLQQQLAQEQTQKTTAALKQQSAQRLKDIDALREKEAAAFTSRQKGFDLEIARMDAEGKSSRQLKLDKIQDIIDEQKAILESNSAKIQVWVDYYTQLAALRGQSEEEFKASMLKQGVDLDALQSQANAALQTNRDSVYAAETELIALKNQFRSEDKSAAEQATKDKQKILDDQAKADQDAYDKRMALLMQEIAANEKAADELFNRRTAARDKLHELRVAESESEYDDLQLAHEMRIEALDETIPEENALKLYYEELYLQEKEALRIAYDEADAAADEAEKQRKMDLGFELANQTMATATALNDFANQIGNNRIKELERQAKKDLSMQGLTAMQKYNIELKLAEEKDKILKRQFNRNKAIKITEGVINTASAVLQALGSAPPPANFILAGLAGIAGAATVATIAAQKFEGSAGAISPPSFTSGGGADTGGGGSSDSGSTTPTGSQQTNTTTSTQNLINGNPGKVVLSMVELNETQTEMNKIEAVSSVG